MSDAHLRERLIEVARSPVLLVAADFDGTLAPIVSRPDQAETDRETLVALRMLSELPHTHVAVISGRSLSDLALRTADAGPLHLVGSHGGEFESGLLQSLSPDARDLLARIKEELSSIVSAAEGFALEEKPASVAFHYRNADEAIARQAVRRIETGVAVLPGVYVHYGKKVIELSVVETNKGAALAKLRRRLGASAVLFIGDDVTDEDAFATLGGPDIGVKVGPGETIAAHRASDTRCVALLLRRVAEARTEWLAGSRSTPIECHSLLSDQRTVALIDAAGRVVWMCAPRIDSAALFAELLGGPSAGFFEVRPVDAGMHARCAYEPDTFVHRTQWPNVTVVDYLDCGGVRAFQRAGRTDLVRVVEGHGAVRVTFAPRLDFGRTATKLRIVPDGIELEGAIDPIVLRAPGLPWKLTEEGKHQTVVAEFELGDDPLVLEFRYGTGNLAPDPLPERLRRERTSRFWSGWAEAITPTHVESAAVRRSALVLKALTYGPTGAVAAAATTSLPEHEGGVRNWDYRFCWPRDAAMATSALVRLGVTGPAIKFLDWILGIFEPLDPGSLINPVYTVTGGHLGPEGEIAELTGYCGSRPVRVGNAAAHQIQLDVLGPIAELIKLLADRGAALSSEHWRLVEAMVAAVERRWGEADHGIWEVRRERRHHVHSKVMCWQTVNCALRVAEYLGRRRTEWAALRDQMAEDVLSRGWNARRSAFCAAYESDDADAAALSVGLSGLLSPDDPRFIGTVELIERELLSGATVRRYHYDDGLPGEEGGFHLCTSWLIEALARCGRGDGAVRLFEHYVSYCGPTGLMSEEYDPRRRRALGNFPQVYSHIGLIHAALAIDALDGAARANA